MAETLIALGIVGIIAALTLPSVTSSYQKKVYVVQLQKTYGLLANAYTQLLADEHVENLGDSSLADSCTSTSCSGIENFFNTYFNVTKDCGWATRSSDCFASSYKSLDGSVSSSPDLYGYCVTINSGASICMSSIGSDSEDYHGCGAVFIDVNGKKAPNTGGRDLFKFDYFTNGKMSESWLPDESRCLSESSTNLSAVYGVGCLTKIINSGWKMDY